MKDNIEAAPEARDSVLEKKGVLKDQKADEGYEFFEEGVSQSIPQDVADAVRRKIDMHLLVLMCALYGLNYVDKVAIGWAVLFNFRKDLGLVGDEYSWASSMFYLSVPQKSRLLVELQLTSLPAAILLLSILPTTCCSAARLSRFCLAQSLLGEY